MLNTEIMKKLKIQVIVSAFFWSFLLFYSNYTDAQNRWKVSFRPGIGFSTGKIRDTRLDIGYGLEGTVSYKFQQHLSVFAGWSFNSFSAKQSVTGINGEFDESGYNFGFQFIHPIAEASKFSYVVGIGGTYNHIEAENYKRETMANSGYGLGWQMEAGFSYAILKKLDVMPTVRYRSLSRDIMIENTITPIHLNYVSFGAAMILSF